MVEFELNGESVAVDVPADTPLLWVVREELALNGSKFGCGKALCGACTMHMNGTAIRSCVMPVAGVAGQKVTTIEGIPKDALHAVQEAWIKHQVPQCGYCQSGQIMQAVSYLDSSDSVSEEGLVAAMNGNICRCGSYLEIKAAILEAAQVMGKLK